MELSYWTFFAYRLAILRVDDGDHSKAGINSMFNTATVVGVGVNIHGSGFPRNFVASFSEGGAAGFSDVQLSKFLSRLPNG